jgi:isopenicillin-N N-acyltransferase-like protein
MSPDPFDSPWLNKASKLGAVFDITPEIREDSIEVRLQPTGTVLGRRVREDGTPCEEEIGMLVALNGIFELHGVINGSTFLVEPKRSATGEMLFGRNVDLDGFGCLDRLSLVTVCRPEGRHAYASVGFPGFLGVFSGMNDAGLAVAALRAYDAADDSPKFNPLGTPLYLTFRQILEECRTVEEAEQLLKGGTFTTRIILSVCDTQ